MLALVALLALGGCTGTDDTANGEPATTAEPPATTDAAAADPEAEVPEDATALAGDDVDHVEALMASAGFTNVRTEPIYDLILGLLVGDGEVERVTIDGQESYTQGDIYAADAEVVVEYHTFASDEPTAEATATPPPSDAPTESASPTADPDPGPEPVVTVDNSSDLRALITVGDYCDPRVARFAEAFRDRVVTFDASVVGLALHGSYTTRYDLLLGAGDAGPNTVRGPAFKMADVNLSSDLAWAGRQPDRLGPGDLLEVTASVARYDRRQCVMFIEPVSTKIRRG